MIIPVYCDFDPGGPLSKDDALNLLKRMQQQAFNREGENMVIRKDGKDEERTRSFHYASGQEQALRWAIEVVERITGDAAGDRKTIEQVADDLERTVEHLRRLAGTIE